MSKKIFLNLFLVAQLSVPYIAAQAAKPVEQVQTNQAVVPAQSTLLVTQETVAHQKLSFDHKGLPTILWYFAPWCGYCKTMYPLILELEKRYTTQLYIVVVDMDDKRNAELIKKYRGEPGPVPYTQFYDKDGNYLDEHLGALSQSEMFGILSTHYKLK